MFGNLFNDNMTDKNVAKRTTKTVDGQVIEQPPNSRDSRNLIGIKNQGATCYLNSLLQTLFLTPEFREALFSLGPEELGKVSDKDKNTKVRVIPLELQLLFARLLLIDQDACTTKELTDSFGWKNSEQFQQHDVQELSRILFDALETSLVATSGSNLIHDLFKGNIVNQIECCMCGNVSERKEEFLDITVSVASKNSLEKSLSDVYESQELMSGKNQYFCEQCNKLVNAKKGAKLGSCPPILTLSLLRFNYDMQTFSRYKETGHFAFPVKLNVENYCKHQDASVCTEYTLYSVIIHKGSAHRGHYHAYIRDVDGLGHSDIPVADCDYEPNFSSMPKSNLQQLPKKGDENEEEMGPEELLACLMSVKGVIRVSELGRVLHEETGITWSKKFRKRYGTMLKFIRSCKQTFVLDSMEQTVSLCDSPNSTFSPIQPPLDTLPEEGLQQEHAEVLNGENLPSPIPNENDLTVLEENSETYYDCTDISTNGEKHRIGSSWFNVNDEVLKPISVYAITDQFSGQQSAYMLFYRRKDLQRPKECWGDRSYRIPPHIVNVIDKENERLSHWREVYDEAANRLDLHIHIETTCFFKNHLILPNEQKGCLINIDQRENISRLLTVINDRVLKLSRRKKKQRLKVYHDLNQQIFEKQDGQYTHLHTMKVLPHGGIHLYNCVSEKKEITLKGAKIESEMHLFFWNGKSILGKEISCGYDWELVAVVLQCTISETCHCEFNFAVKHEMCFDTVKLYASILLQVGIEEIAVEWRTKVVDQESTGDVFYIDLNQVGDETLQYNEMFRAKIKSNSEGSETNAASRSDEKDEANIHLKVQNTMLKCDKKVLKDAIYTFEVSSEKTIEDLKVIIAKTLQIKQSNDKFRLSLLSNDEKVPLQESLTLLNHEITETDMLVLEEFPGPSGEQIILFVKPLLENAFVEVMVDRTSDMFQLLKVIEKHLDIKDNDWHLCRSNCYGEKVAILNKFDVNIAMLGIANGTYLMICPGKLLKDGMISIKLWWYPPPRTLCELVKPNEISSYIYESTTQKSNTSLNNSTPLLELQRWQSVDNIDCLGPLEMGNVEVSKDGTLFDLLLAVRNALPKDFKRTGKQLRIRTVDKSVLSRVLPAQAEMTLKRLKIQSSTQLAVQFTDAILSKDQVVLNIIFHVPGTRSYTQPAEFICNASSSELIQELSKMLGIPHTNLKVAKKDSESNSWKVLQIEDIARNKPKKKGGKSNAKRKSTTKSNRDVSTLLKDSDIIGVKILSEEKKHLSVDIGFNDFDTDDDIQKRKTKEKDQKATEANKYSFLSDKNTSKSTDRKSPRNKEAPLKIHVQNFANGESSTEEFSCPEQ